MDSKLIVAENIKKFLKMQKKTQDSLSKHLGITKAAVSNWVNGSTSPDINTITKICNFLDISVNDLFGVYDEKHLSVEEKLVLKSYRESDFRNAINKLLDVK